MKDTEQNKLWEVFFHQLMRTELPKFTHTPIVLVQKEYDEDYAKYCQTVGSKMEH